MTDRERISNLEEMVADILLKLEEVESILNNIPRLADYNKYNLKTLEEGLLELAKKELVLNDRQTLLEKSFALLMEICRRNSEEIQSIQVIQANRKESRTELENAGLFEFLMSKFDIVDERLHQLDGRFNQIEQHFKQIDERFQLIDKLFNREEKKILKQLHKLETKMTQQEEELQKISYEIRALESLVYKLKTEIDSIKNRLYNQ
jgi:DNA repair exonuclease SbcCD ATPase subunit